ncbi:MAG: hypothetical protein U5J95_01685 [Balneolaceae bacterium]|nr:hypothetical protein [Balneolaceae bacterium]
MKKASNRIRAGSFFFRAFGCFEEHPNILALPEATTNYLLKGYTKHPAYINR